MDVCCYICYILENCIIDKNKLNFSWITTRQNAPIQMWDAFDGSLRCTYRGFNAVDEMEPAVTTAFTLDGARIIAGYKKVLRTFDVER